MISQPAATMPAMATAAMATAGPPLRACGARAARRRFRSPPRLSSAGRPSHRAIATPTAGATATTSSGPAIDTNRTEPSAANVQAAAMSNRNGSRDRAGNHTATSRSAARSTRKGSSSTVPKSGEPHSTIAGEKALATARSKG